MDRETRSGRPLLALGILAIGFLAHVVAVVFAVRTPVGSYELSVYDATPAASWIGLGVALTAAVLVSVWSESRPHRYLGYVLGGLSVLTVVLLPLAVGVHFFGRGDALTHLGWVRDIENGLLAPTELLYPAVHVLALLVETLFDVGHPRALLVATYVFPALYVVFLPLTIWALTRHRAAAAVAPLTAFLFLPVNNVGSHMITHPLTLSVFFLPVILFLVVRFVLQGPRIADGVASGYSLALAVSLVAIVLVHPQGALDVLLMLGAIGFVQYVWRRRHPDGYLARRHRPVYRPVAVLAVAFALWVPWHERVLDAASGIVYGLLYGSGAPEVQTKAASLAALGGSVPELFVKLFLPSVLFGAIAAGLVVGLLTGALDDRFPDRNAFVGYLAASTVPLVAMFGLFFVAGFSSQHYRHVAVAAVPLSILGAIGLSDGVPELLPTPSRRTVRIVATVSFAVLLPTALLTVYASPYIYQGSGYVPAAELGGYETTMDVRDPDVAFAGIRAGPNRYVEATLGTVGARQADVPGMSASVPPPVFGTNLTSHYDDPRYLPVSGYNVETEVRLYDGLRYSRAAFDRLETDARIDRVADTGQYTLYLLDASNESDESSETAPERANASSALTVERRGGQTGIRANAASGSELTPTPTDSEAVHPAGIESGLPARGSDAGGSTPPPVDTGEPGRAKPGADPPGPPTTVPVGRNSVSSPNGGPPADVPGIGRRSDRGSNGSAGKE